MSTLGPIDERIDLCFPLVGDRLPVDHGYAIFGAICRVLGDLHGAPWLAVHPIRGVYDGPGSLRLDPGDTWLKLRLPPVQVPRVLPLADQVLQVQGHHLRVGVPIVQRLVGAPCIEARIVVIKGFMEPDSFLAAAARQLEALQVQATMKLTRRRVLAIRGDRVVGFGLALSGLTEDDSLRVQRNNIGGRSRMGCGIFSPRQAMVATPRTSQKENTPCDD